MMNLLYSDTEDAVRESVANVLKKHTAAADLLLRYDVAAPASNSPWPQLGHDLGLTGLLIPEAAGGDGKKAREAAVVLEELGRTLASVPYLTSAVIASTCLTIAGAGPVLSGLLANRGATATVVAPWTAATHTDVTRVRMREDGSLVGGVSTVAYGDSDILIVAADAQGGPQLRLVRRDTDGLQIQPVVSLDMTRPLHDIVFAGAPSQLLATGDAVADSLGQAVQVGAALLASEQIGIAQWCLDETIGYLKQRYQFGRPLASFQALKHRLADLAGDIVTARAAARYAAGCVAEESADLPIAAALAQSHCSLVAVKAAEACLQLHGGIGMTWEHPAHLYLKRAKSDELALGSPALHRAALANLVGIDVGCRSC